MVSPICSAFGTPDSESLKFTCSAQATSPGAAPAYRMSPSTTTGRTGAGHGFVVLTNSPVFRLGVNNPAPPAYITKTSPALAGCASERTVPSRCVIAKIAGVAGTTGRMNVGSVPAGVSIRTAVAPRPATSNGTIALICVDLAYKSGAATSSKNTWTPPILVASAEPFTTAPAGADGPSPCP